MLQVPGMTAKSTADRQKALRERRAAQKLYEVRGIYATEENAKRIKQYAKLLAQTKDE